MIDIDRNRRYTRLLTLAKKPDEPMKAWLWLMAKDFDSYISCQRYMRRQSLSVSEEIASLHLHNDKELG